MTTVAIACAVASAICAALGAFLQHGGVQRVSADAPLRLRSLGLLARDRKWLLGVLAHVGTAVFQILAISLAPLVVVQPIVVLSLPLVALLAARATGFRLSPLAITGIAMTTTGLAVFVVLAANTAVPTTVTGEQAHVAGKFVVGGALLLIVLAATRSGRVRCVALAVAAGALYGLVSVLIRHISRVATTESVFAVPILSVLALAVVFFAGSWLVQHAYSAGPADLVVACMTVLNPIVAIGIGVSVLGETAGVSTAVAAALAVCGAAALAGIVALARSHATTLATTSASHSIALPER